VDWSSVNTELSLPHKLAKHAVGVWGCLFHLVLKEWLRTNVQFGFCWGMVRLWAPGVGA